MKCEPVSIHTSFIRLDAFLKLCGESSTGGQAKIFVQDGLVLVDGVVCLERGRKLYPGTIVSVDDKEYEVSGGEC